MKFKIYPYYPKTLEDKQTLETKGETPFFLSLSNSWSRKTMNLVFSGKANLYDILKEKSEFFLPQENGIGFTEDTLEENFENIDIFLEQWLNKQIILHIDFLLEHRLKNREN